MNHEDKVNSVYQALAEFWISGVKEPNIKLLAQEAGIARSTLYTAHPDWHEIRSILCTGSPNERLKSVLHELKSGKIEVDRLQVRYRKIVSDIKACKADIDGIRNIGDMVYQQLIDQVHKYALLAKNSPNQRAEISKLLSELSSFTRTVEHLTSENKLLKAQKDLPVSIGILSHRKVINVIMKSDLHCDSLDDLFTRSLDRVNDIDDLFIGKHDSQVPRVVYVLCGNFLSGKSSWIKIHQPSVSGVNLYLDGLNHTKAIRTVIIKRIKKLSPGCRIVCVRLLTPMDICLERFKKVMADGKAFDLSEAWIYKVEDAFEEVDVYEGFSSIECVVYSL